MAFDLSHLRDWPNQLFTFRPDETDREMIWIGIYPIVPLADRTRQPF